MWVHLGPSWMTQDSYCLGVFITSAKYLLLSWYSPVSGDLDVLGGAAIHYWKVTRSHSSHSSCSWREECLPSLWSLGASLKKKKKTTGCGCTHLQSQRLVGKTGESEFGVIFVYIACLRQTRILKILSQEKEIFFFYVKGFWGDGSVVRVLAA